MLIDKNNELQIKNNLNQLNLMNKMKKKIETDMINDSRLDDSNLLLNLNSSTDKDIKQKDSEQSSPIKSNFLYDSFPRYSKNLNKMNSDLKFAERKNAQGSSDQTALEMMGLSQQEQELNSNISSS